jgi:hypothetical protein
VTQGAFPRLRFVIGGVQKGGTTALASFLGRHPGVALPEGKEAHVFDAPGFDDAWSVEAVDAQFAPHFQGAAAGAMHGDATPIYILHPTFIRRIARYNPEMRWIILLRDPVDRALSQYHMERSRGDEHLPLWCALLAEPWRLRGHEDDFSNGSPLRHHSYRLRGDYATQLEALHAHFPPEQVLVLRNRDLAMSPDATMQRIYSFLGLQTPADAVDYGRVFEGEYQRWSRNDWRRRLLRWWWRAEFESQARVGWEWGQ